MQHFADRPYPHHGWHCALCMSALDFDFGNVLPHRLEGEGETPASRGVGMARVALLRSSPAIFPVGLHSLSHRRLAHYPEGLWNGFVR
jgi:hypothetical protein